MPNCYIKNCDSYKSNTVYFKFPINDPQLLQKWLDEIGETNRQPNEHSYICAAHFCSTDIIQSAQKECVVLKKNAIPTIFQKHINGICSLKVEESEVPVANHCTNVQCDIPVVPTIIPATPLMIQSTIAESLTKMNSTLLSLRSTQQRFRKILPKLDQNTNANHNNSPEKNDIALNASPQSYIVIIPTVDNTKSLSIPNNPPKMPSPNKRKSTLKLTINRKYDRDPSLQKLKNCDDHTTEIESNFTLNRNKLNGNDMIEEVIINHKTLNKYVVYSLDLITNQISVCYRDIPTVSNQKPKLSEMHMKLRVNPKKKKIMNQSEELGNMYKRVKQDCSTLRSKLQILRKKHQKEKEAIEKLQNQLSAIEQSQNTSSTMLEELQVNFQKSPLIFDEDMKSLKKNCAIIKQKKELINKSPQQTSCCTE